MENFGIVIEDIRTMRKNAKGLLEKAERLEKSVWEIKSASRKEKDLKKKKEYKDVIEEISFQLYGLRRDLEDLEDSDLFRDKIDIPKHNKR